jgi:hypothetical protein
VYLEPDQSGSAVGQQVKPTLRKTIVDSDRLALNPAELTQSLPEPLDEETLGAVEEAIPR